MPIRATDGWLINAHPVNYHPWLYWLDSKIVSTDGREYAQQVITGKWIHKFALGIIGNEDVSELSIAPLSNNITMNYGKSILSNIIVENYAIGVIGTSDGVEHAIGILANHNKNNFAVSTISNQALPRTNIATQSENMLVNGNMEIFTGTANDGISDTIFGWINYDPGNPDNEVRETVTNAYKGNYALKLSTVSGWNPIIAQVIDVKPNARHKISFATHGDGINAANYGLWSGSNFAASNSVGGGGTGVSGSAWEIVTACVTSLPNETKFYIYFYGTPVSGSVWYDDVAIVELFE